MSAIHRHAVLILAAALGLGACATAPDEADDRPAWIDRPADEYPGDLYVVGLGEATSAELARERARADLARGFEVAIRAESVDVEEFGRIGPAGSEEGHLSSRVEREIRTRTDIVLAGVEFAETWRDPADATHYALAVITKPRAANRLRDEIRTLDRDSVHHAEEAAGEDDPIRRLRALDRAIDRQVQREALNRQLRVVGPGGRGIESPAPLAELAAEYRRTAANLRLDARAEGAAREDIGAVLAAAIADAGFGPASGGADYEIVVSLDLDDLGERSDWYWYRGYLRLEVRDGDGSVRNAERWAVRAAATDRPTAWRRVVDEATAGLGQRLHTALMASGEA